jgi:hypothetical protein
MRRTFVVVLGVAALAVALLGCGSSDDGAATETPAATTPAAESPAAESPAAASPAAASSAADGWTTVTTLRSDDPTNEIGALVSEAFTVTGEVRLVLDMPDGEDAEGLIAAILPAGEEITVDLVRESESVPVAVVLPDPTVDGLDGSYVVLATPSTDKAWSLEIQTKP